jgi:type II secretory pathway component PulC
MNQRRIRTILWLTASGQLAVGLAAALLLYHWPYPSPPGASTTVQAAPVTAHKPTQVLPPWEEIRRAMSVDLRRPLFDPPPPVAKAPPPPKPLMIKLEGTIIEPDNSVAMIVDSRGQMKWYTVGQKVEEATLMKIEPDVVTLKHHGRSVRVERKREEGSR